MIINEDYYKKLRTIHATLEVADNAATDILFTIDDSAPRGSFPSPNWIPQSIQVVSSVGAQKTGWAYSYNRSGVSAGILTLNKGTLTFATGDIITLIGNYV